MLLPALLLALVLAAGSGCSDGSVRIEPPTPDASGARACAALAVELPAEVDGGARRPVSPQSPLTAAWGDPAVTVRCGVAAPAGFGPTSLLTTVDGVDWYPVDDQTYAATGRVVWIEVTVPEGGSIAGTLVDLAPAVSGVPES